MMNSEQLIAEAVVVLVPAAGGLLLALLSWALAELARYVRSRTQSEAVNNALARIGYMAQTVVADLNQQLADGMRAAAADGKITAEDARQLKQRAVALVQTQLGPQVLELARQGVSDLAVFIGARVERAVREQKGNG